MAGQEGISYAAADIQHTEPISRGIGRCARPGPSTGYLGWARGQCSATTTSSESSPTTRSSRHASWGGDSSENPLGASLVGTDPPRHRLLRSLVTQAFTTRKIAQLEPRIREITAELLDHVAPKGRMDLIGDLSVPAPGHRDRRAAGIPSADRDRFKRWSDALVTGHGDGHGGTQREMAEYFLRMIERKRHEPATT